MGYAKRQGLSTGEVIVVPDFVPDDDFGELV